MEIMELELSSNCQCRYCDACGLGTESELCDECQIETRYCSFCDGACWEYKIDWIDDLLSQFAEDNSCDIIKISGKDIGWRRLSGYSHCEPNFKSFINTMTFNGDWTLNIKSDGENVTITRYSHDEPTGASFILASATREE